MKKIVVNKCYGGFSISYEALKFLAKKGVPEAIKELKNNPTPNKFNSYCRDIDRDNKYLVKAVETMGEEVNGQCAELKIKEIPDDILWEIDEYDGMERVEEKHRSW